ncbi:MAG: Rid family hydrolase [Bacteroidales bacterium]|nr:Rid family hydrolase [Bacteroidales bacterium]
MNNRLIRKECCAVNVKIELCYFTKRECLSECHTVFHISDAKLCFLDQLKAITSAYNELKIKMDGLSPVFKRFFVSDAANQEEHIGLLFDDSRFSVVQQPPLDGTKIALWCYFSIKEHNGYDHLWNVLRPKIKSSVSVQTDELFKRYITFLEREGCTLEDCVRTWIFVRDIDLNYQEMVKKRRELFSINGLTEQTHFIASTGIEGKNNTSSNMVMIDTYAVKGLDDGQQKYLYANSYLNKTHEYGVTFERGVKVEYGDRNHILISGTASINSNGEVVSLNDVAGQTLRMLENICALLQDGGASLDDIVQMIIYLRDFNDYDVVKEIIENILPSVPKVYTLASVCRTKWLIEAECIAITDNDNNNFRKL